MKRVLQNERGMALALAIVALVVVGALVAGAFFAGTQEQRVGENSRRVLTSFGVAEAGMLEVVRTWQDSTGVFNSLASYPSVPSTRTWPTVQSPSHTGAYSGTLYKLNDQIFLIDMTGTDSAPGLSSQQVAWLQRRGGGASQRLGLLTSIRALQMDIRASLTSGRGDALSGNARIDGYDHVPPNWDTWTTCGPLDSAKAGIHTDTSMAISTGGTATVTGVPNVMRDPNVTDSTFSKYGDVTYSQLAGRANITLPGQNFSNNIGPVVTGGQCDKSVVTNWGDGVNGGACSNYFPIVHITSDATINGVQGQGILLIDGSLSVQGGFQWFGITIVRGTLSTAGGGATDAHFWGTTMVQDSVVVGNNTLTGHANILYSKCAILKALDATGVATMMRSRSWVQLF